MQFLSPSNLKLFAWIAGFFIVIFILKVIIKKFTPKEKCPYLKVDSLLTKAEKDFFFILQEVVGSEYLIFSKVRLADLLKLPKMNRSDFHHYFNKIQAKHVDFLLCDKNSTKPLLAIELDDSTHLLKKRRQRDDFVNEVFENAEIPLLRIKNSSNYNKENLSSKIHSHFS